MNDAAILRKQKAWAKQDKQELDNCVGALMKHAEGRRYLYWLLETGNALFNSQLFTGNALTTAFECGRQDVGKQILAHLLEIAPDGFLTMLKERENERKSRNESASQPTASDESARAESSLTSS